MKNIMKKTVTPEMSAFFLAHEVNYTRTPSGGIHSTSYHNDNHEGYVVYERLSNGMYQCLFKKEQFGELIEIYGLTKFNLMRRIAWHYKNNYA